MKCKFCGKYEMRQKEVKKTKCKILEDVYPEVEIPVLHMWKWCKLHNNWCKFVAGNCGEIVKKVEKKVEGDTNEIV